jgi:hypothetical protein
MANLVLGIITIIECIGLLFVSLVLWRKED